MNGFIHPFHLNRNHLIGEMIVPGIVEVEGEKYLLYPNTFFTNEKVHLFLMQDKYETDSEYNVILERKKLEQEAHIKRNEELYEKEKEIP